MEAKLLGTQLIEACLERNGHRANGLVKAGAPLWYQEPDSGWTCLHIAANFGDLSLVKQLLDAGAIWNAGRLYIITLKFWISLVSDISTAVDASGFTPVDVALSLNDLSSFCVFQCLDLYSQAHH
jgi:protein arginine N-methyltransferase 2